MATKWRWGSHRGTGRPEGDRPAPDAGGDREGRRRATILCMLALPVLIAFYVVFLYWSSPHTPGRQLRLDQYLTLLRQGQIQDAVILDTDNRITGNYTGGPYWIAFGSQVSPVYGQLTGALEAAGVPTTLRQEPLKNLVGPVTILLPALIIVDGFFLIFLLFGRGDQTFGGIGRAGARRQVTGTSKITFADVAGVEEAIEELQEVRDYLSRPDRFLAMGAAVPKGILLTGPPGCGKTLLARALAGESQVPFFSISGSDFVEIFVGVGAARIRDLFRVAKEAAPCICFIDELDAVGRGRTAMAVGGQDEREATLNQLLVEMDGFESGSGVVVLAATNRPDILDAALLRPGRFDRRVGIDRPDVRGREGVLKIHARGKPLSSDIDMAAVAKRTVGFSGADLANVVNEAALLAARRGSTQVEAKHMFEAIERVVAGPERHTRILSPQDRYRIAFHEAGHAVAATALPGTDRVGKLSIVARGHAGGFTWSAPEGDSLSVTRSQLLDRIAATMGGRVAEEIVTGEFSSGSQSDLEQAGTLARRMVADFGMSTRLGPYIVKPFSNGYQGEMGVGYSERIAGEIDAETQAILAEAEQRAREVLVANRANLDQLAHALMEPESLEGDALDDLLLHLTGTAATPAGAGAGTAGA